MIKTEEAERLVQKYIFRKDLYKHPTFVFIH